jgi:hypothetical protein
MRLVDNLWISKNRLLLFARQRQDVSIAEYVWGLGD